MSQPDWQTGFNLTTRILARHCWLSNEAYQDGSRQPIKEVSRRLRKARSEHIMSAKRKKKAEEEQHDLERK